MEIIQQKLIWFMGCLTALILLFKLRLGPAGIKQSSIKRMRAGVILLMFGSFWGIALKTAIPDSGFVTSGTAFIVETLLGYTMGWALLLWGIVSWARSYFDLKGRPLTTAGSRMISDIILKSLIRGNGAKLLFNSISNDLISLLGCQALTFHKIVRYNKLKIAFHNGLTDSSARLLRVPRGERNVFMMTMKSRQAVISDENHTLHDFSFAETLKGRIAASISIPVTYNGQLMGVMTAYRTKNKPFNEDDLKVLEMGASGLGASLVKEDNDKMNQQESRFKELLTVVGKSLDTGQPMLSALVKSAKTITNYLPFKWICLYVIGNGTPKSYEFDLPTGGMVKMVEGWFPQNGIPRLNKQDNKADPKTSPETNETVEESTHLFPVGESGCPAGYLEFALETPMESNSYLSLLANMMGKRFALYLHENRFQERVKTFEGWLGGLQYFLERGTQGENVTGLLKEITSSAVDLAPSTYCRILLADPKRKYLKTAAIAQKRELTWNTDFKSNIQLSELKYHKTALESGAVVTFNQEDYARRLSKDEALKTLPSEAKCGVIAPLTMCGKTVGLLTVGDCRKASRVFENSDPMHFLNALSGVISIILAWHKEKRISREGGKKLTLHKKGSRRKKDTEVPAVRINSRINGPLAGILAACEYLKSGLHTEKDDVNRYLDIIERNASQIHQDISSS